jgi:hypothetical protein
MDVNRDSQQSAEEHRRRSPLMAADQRKVWPRIARMNTQKQSAISNQHSAKQSAISNWPNPLYRKGREARKERNFHFREFMKYRRCYQPPRAKSQKPRAR